ncbi:hypothetical protein XA68_15727 [Ophiocordyceps unilateralis]|uniref:Phosphatidylinositol N-acetylglucosaminyltransferase subunit H conserved domain-containing protein n=1 Tax=Ophiocordyceps unilateralis TaxID=268505 RepID=A0A2A9P7Z7_OPHUN|nr:hypothetical protein XA68_15727 [Ophiocordyceps unilateralis]
MRLVDSGRASPLTFDLSPFTLQIVASVSPNQLLAAIAHASTTTLSIPDMLFTTPPRLHIRRPSPTAAEFIVTTRPSPPATLLSLRLLLRLPLLLLRFGLGLAALLLLYTHWAANFPDLAPPALGFLLLDRHDVLAIPLPVLLPAALATLWLVCRRLYAQESLLVLRGLGVQTTEQSPSYLARSATRFIPTEKIQDIFINEAFRGFEVRYYLVVVVEGEPDVVVVFPGLLPPRHIVEAVWRGARECLYEGRAEDKGLSL